MDTTSASLLIRVRSNGDSAAWSRFVELYTPLIFYWAKRTGLNSHDAADLVQDVLTQLVKKLPEMEYDESKSFRGWLRKVTLNKWRERARKKQLNVANVTTSEMGAIAEPLASIEFWERDYRQELVARAMQLSKNQFEPKTWAALEEYVKTGMPAGQIAKKHCLSVWTVYSAKSRLMQSLRHELDGLLD